jgi:hypothetical protein
MIKFASRSEGIPMDGEEISAVDGIDMVVVVKKQSARWKRVPGSEPALDSIYL